MNDYHSKVKQIRNRKKKLNNLIRQANIELKTLYKAKQREIKTNHAKPN
jgi:hypothetical protein